jgi:nitrous oxidase accessory protein
VGRRVDARPRSQRHRRPPHRELIVGRLRRELPAIGLLAGSSAERLLRFVHARLAIPGAGGIVDPSPLVGPGPSATGASR